ncbi:MAG TPA: hypothetical protein VMM56_11435, partial [Planctomycetaceae bacterium]|nr:hypothetical protein [Planctomycetaceae bacterium]
NSASSGDGNPARSGLHQSLQNLVRTAVRIAGLFLSPSLENRPRMFSGTLPEEVTIDGFETELGLSPAIGIGKRKLVAANSRELVERSFGASNDLSDAKKLSTRLTRFANRCNLGFYLNLNELRSSLASHSEALFRLQNIDEQQRAEAKLRLARQMEVFSLVDTVYLFGVISKDLVSFHFGVESLPGDR